MSVQASIDIEFSHLSQNYKNRLDLIKILLDEGWTLNDNNGISYLPLGDDGDFDWILSAKISQNELMKILEEKEKNRELIAIVLTWKDTNIGGSVLFYSTSNEISFICTRDRQILYGLNNFKMTNANWYLSRLIPIFYKTNIPIKSFIFDELK